MNFESTEQCPDCGSASGFYFRATIDVLLVGSWGGANGPRIHSYPQNNNCENHGAVRCRNCHAVLQQRNPIEGPKPGVFEEIPPMWIPSAWESWKQGNTYYDYLTMWGNLKDQTKEDKLTARQYIRHCQIWHNRVNEDD